MTREQKIARIEKLKKEIHEAYKRGECSSEIVNKVNECTRLALEVINEW
ncbi:hypothetical protein SAMN02745135_01138 [Caloranaerobacter azorensis DSM 13643]|uniref:Uncharacterized protein n=1 Tax=Caloranaerobacter azorensis DSM 13643 TaxID=1121264 RepID=A0A1M5TUF1_9FIRM|nr:hypothetical protein [Caloranaerobacter azorensis]SHH54308.1 hypothetical protein SAMN02745135_01138 [Caloranaerobacter azorensis DSM 13643]